METIDPLQTSTAIRRQFVLNCRACSLRSEARIPVPHAGNLRSKIMVLGRNPGRQEDANGVPFFHRAPGGRTLNQVLESAGIDRNELLVTNLAKCYSADDRQPTDEEYRSCADTHLIQEISLFKPELIIALGNDAFRFVTGMLDHKVRFHRREMIEVHMPLVSCPTNFTDLVTLAPSKPDVWMTTVVGMWHPGYAVRNPQAKQELLDDFAWLVGHPLFVAAYSN